MEWRWTSFYLRWRLQFSTRFGLVSYVHSFDGRSYQVLQRRFFQFFLVFFFFCDFLSFLHFFNQSPKARVVGVFLVQYSSEVKFFYLSSHFEMCEWNRPNSNDEGIRWLMKVRFFDDG